MAEEVPRSISIVYEDAPSRPTIIVTGAFGGPTPDGGLVVAHLYADVPPTPSIETHDMSKTGAVNLASGQTVRRADIVREVQATMLLTPNAAKALGKWLTEKARLVEEQNK